MAKIERFEDLECWKSARKFTNLVYSSLENCKDYGFCDQMKRASVSVMNNIAERFPRLSARDRIHFFNIAVSSLSEVRSMTYLGGDRNYISEGEQEILMSALSETSGFTYGFLRHLHKTTQST